MKPRIQCDAGCHIRPAEASDAEAVADMAAGLAATRDCALVALATRRAAPFYHALGYEESAVYFRKILDDQAGN
jgi:hypothetical protein